MELADREALKYMLERLQGQKSQELAMIRDLDPYFNFQTRISDSLNKLSNDRESRLKMQENKIKQIKQ